MPKQNIELVIEEQELGEIDGIEELTNEENDDIKKEKKVRNKWKDPNTKKEYSKIYFQEHKDEFNKTCRLQYFKRNYGVEFSREEYDLLNGGGDLKRIARFTSDVEYIKKNYPEYFYKILTKV
jgi:hypothetical protein